MRKHRGLPPLLESDDDAHMRNTLRNGKRADSRLETASQDTPDSLCGSSGRPPPRRTRRAGLPARPRSRRPSTSAPGRGRPRSGTPGGPRSEVPRAARRNHGRRSTLAPAPSEGRRNRTARAPASMRASAISSPSPRLPPETSATRSASENSCVKSVGFAAAGIVARGARGSSRQLVGDAIMGVRGDGG